MNVIILPCFSPSVAVDKWVWLCRRMMPLYCGNHFVILLCACTTVTLLMYWTSLGPRTSSFSQVQWTRPYGGWVTLHKMYIILNSIFCRLWHISRKECLCCFQHVDFVTAIAFHPRVSGQSDGSVRSCDYDCSPRMIGTS